MNYRPRNYSWKTALGGLAVAGCIIAGMWWVLFN